MDLTRITLLALSNVKGGRYMMHSWLAAARSGLPPGTNVRPQICPSFQYNLAEGIETVTCDISKILELLPPIF